MRPAAQQAKVDAWVGMSLGHLVSMAFSLDTCARPLAVTAPLGGLSWASSLGWTVPQAGIHLVSSWLEGHTQQQCGQGAEASLPRRAVSGGRGF